MESVVHILEQLPLVQFSAGEVILKEGTSQTGLFFLVSGTVEVSKQGEPITRVREVGAVFGEMSILLDAPYTATVTAATEVECRVAQRPIAFLEEHPNVMLYVARILARRLDALNRYLLDVKAQFREQEGHLGMVDEVLDALMSRHPRQIAIPRDPGS
jgi:CRP-like cAMP-binding protein